MPKLKRTIKIPKGTEFLDDGLKSISFNEPVYELLIGIGNDHTATLIISKEAFEELHKFKNEISL